MATINIPIDPAFIRNMNQFMVNVQRMQQLTTQVL